MGMYSHSRYAVSLIIGTSVLQLHTLSSQLWHWLISCAHLNFYDATPYQTNNYRILAVEIPFLEVPLYIHVQQIFPYGHSVPLFSL